MSYPKLPAFKKQNGLDLIMEVGIKANDYLSSLASEDNMPNPSKDFDDNQSLILKKENRMVNGNVKARCENKQK